MYKKMYSLWVTVIICLTPICHNSMDIASEQPVILVKLVVIDIRTHFIEESLVNTTLVRKNRCWVVETRHFASDLCSPDLVCALFKCLFVLPYFSFIFLFVLSSSPRTSPVTFTETNPASFWTPDITHIPLLTRLCVFVLSCLVLRVIVTSDHFNTTYPPCTYTLNVCVRVCVLVVKGGNSKVKIVPGFGRGIVLNHNC